MKVSVVGLGKLGMPMAAVFASKGMKTLGVDKNERLIYALQTDQEIPIHETQLATYLSMATDNIAFKDDFSGVADTDITFIIVPTPSVEDGSFTNLFVESAIRDISNAIKFKRDYHLIVVTSTVMPASMRYFATVIEEITNKAVGGSVGLCYNPEFIALGSVIQNILNPDAILIGESDTKAGDLLVSFYKKVCENDPPIHRMSWENAECAKLMLNIAVTTKISLANAFAEICEKIPNGDIDRITNFLGDDKRIGRKYLTGGTAYAGPCFPRDCIAFMNLAERLGVKHMIAPAIHNTNEWQNERLYKMVKDLIAKDLEPKVAILGLAYKTGTGITEKSAGFTLALALQRDGVKVATYDGSQFLIGIETLKNHTYNVENILRGANLAVIALPGLEYKLSSLYFKSYMKTPRVLDCWRILNREKCLQDGVEYHAIGMGA